MADKPLTWEEKLENGVPLNELEETKYAATRNTLRRLREQEEERKYADDKSANLLKPLSFESSQSSETSEVEKEPEVAEETSPKTQTEKKGDK